MKKRMVLLPALLALYAGLAFGQATNSADITGTVTDSTGAVIPGVSVRVTDADKNLTREYVTNSAGLYDTGPLVPGDHYVVEFTKEGFAPYKRGPMLLGVGVTGLNVRLGLGQVTQQVEVSAEAPLLETTTPELGGTIHAETLQTLPQTGAPDWQSFITLLPGTAGTPQGGNNAANPGMGGVAANGSLPFSSALMDGANTSSPMSNNVIMTPIFDSIGEVKISDSLFSAQYGTGGLLFNQISKGGTNSFHGTAFDYFQNDALNAADYAFGTGKVSPLHYNAFGGTIGGPIIKNRVFFFFALENTINHGGANLGLTTVPTAAMRAGDFTGISTIYDPTTQTVDPLTGVVTRQSFASEYGTGNRIPDNMIDPVAKSIQALYPEPNQAGTLVNGVTKNNFSYILPNVRPVRKYFGRFDADLTQNNRLTGSSAWNNNHTRGLSPVCPINCTDVDIFNTNNQLSDVWTISPTMINEARIGFMGEYDLLRPQTIDAGWPDKLGLKFAKQDIFPTINIGSNTWYGLAPGTHANYKENLFDFSDVVTLIHGRHVLHFGGELITMRADSTAWGNIHSADLGFTGVYTTGSNQGALAKSTGSPYADFLLGYAHDWSASFSPEYGARLKSPAVFVQDDVKITPKLTLNLGLRWHGTTGWSEVQGNVRSFDPAIINPATNAPGGMWFGTTQENGRNALQQSVWDIFLPRLGAAYQLGDKWTVRGGFGMYTFPWNVDTYGHGLGSVFSSSGNQTDSTNGAAPVVVLNSDGNTNYQGSLGASVNTIYKNAPQTADGYNGQRVDFTQYDSPVPILEQWNLTVERQVSNNMLVRAAYVASHGRNLAVLTDLNQVPVEHLGPNDAQFRPYPQFQSITGTNAVGISNYRSLQVTVERRMASGLMLNFNYTWSKMMDDQDSSGWGSKQGNQPYQYAYDPHANYGPSNFDIRHMFKGQAVYDLPFGPGRAFLQNSRVLDQIIGGWTLSGTIVAQGGNPYTPYMLVDNSYSLSSNAVQYPNVVGSAALSNPTIDQWFDVGALVAPDPGTFGNFKRNSLYGPGLTAVNMSLRKSFPITERIKFDLSGHATNVLNHPSFGQPDRLIGPGHKGQITSVTVGGRRMEIVAKFRF